MGETRVRRVGVIGGGQLAWMMADASQVLGLELWVQTPAMTDPAAAIATHTILAAVDDAQATAQLAQHCDVITFENEFVELAALANLENSGVCFRPKLEAIKPLLDKSHQRDYMQRIGLSTPKFAVLDRGFSADQLDGAIAQMGFPLVLKMRRHGYDGQGTFIMMDPSDLQSVLQKTGHQPMLLEEFVPFERELAVMAARSQQGEVVIYPIVETQQEKQVCRRVFAPTVLPRTVDQHIREMAVKLLNSLDFVGILGMELFLLPDGKVLMNEIAPRTHNSGHYTLDVCQTSQFEQQLRAVCGRPLGSTQMTARQAVMVNLLGYEVAQDDYQTKRRQIAQMPGARVHWYGKQESRPGRKLGHVTIVLPDDEASSVPCLAAQKAAHQTESIWYST